MEWRVLWMVKWLLLQIWCTVFRQSMPFVVDRVLQMKDQSNEFFLALQQIADYVRSIHTLASAAYGSQRASPGITTSTNWPLASVWLTDKPSQSALAYKHASWDSRENTWPCCIWKQERGVLRPRRWNRQFQLTRCCLLHLSKLAELYETSREVKSNSLTASVAVLKTT